MDEVSYKTTGIMTENRHPGGEERGEKTTTETRREPSVLLPRGHNGYAVVEALWGRLLHQ